MYILNIGTLLQTFIKVTSYIIMNRTSSDMILFAIEKDKIRNGNNE